MNKNSTTPRTDTSSPGVDMNESFKRYAEAMQKLNGSLKNFETVFGDGPDGLQHFAQ